MTYYYWKPVCFNVKVKRAGVACNNIEKSKCREENGPNSNQLHDLILKIKWIHALHTVFSKTHFPSKTFQTEIRVKSKLP